MRIRSFKAVRRCLRFAHPETLSAKENLSATTEALSTTMLSQLVDPKDRVVYVAVQRTEIVSSILLHIIDWRVIIL